MQPLVVHADAELAVIQFLSALDAVVALVPYARISSELPARPVYPAVLVTRVSGQVIYPALDQPAIAVDVYGTDKATAQRLMQTVRGALLSISNDRVPECVLVSAEEELGPQWLPDTVAATPIPRYTARYRVLTHI